ncbi:helix-turn-helix transcriptional regulator [Hyphobacterium sp. CCMP332]|nr:helix-turn-helix transcriptional regulator [Hyphobacterium sp. CCMP332]
MDAIVVKIKSLLETKKLSASEFADLIGVKRANVSHVLSGRNKPSLDFVIKLCESFEEIDLNALLLNKNSRLQNDANEIESSENVIIKKNDLYEHSLSQLDNNSEIERIVIFFKNGSFKDYGNHETT